MWTVVFYTGHSTITRRFAEQPEDRELEAYALRYSAASVRICPPTS